MIFEVIEVLLPILLVLAAIYLVYRVVSKEIEKKKAMVEAKKFMQWLDAKAIVIAEADNFSRANNVSFEKAAMSVISSDYIPGVGLVKPLEETLAQPPARQARRERQ